MITGRAGCAVWPGQGAAWTFVVGHRCIAALPVGTGRHVVERLDGLVSGDDAEVEAAVSLLPLAGPDAVEDFAVLVLRPTPDPGGVHVTAVLRGAVAVDLYPVTGSARRVTAGAIRPWLLAEYQSMTGVAIGSPGYPIPPADRLQGGASVDSGVVTGSTLFWSVASESVEETVLRAPRSAAALESDTILRPRGVADDTVVGGARAVAGEKPPGRSATADARVAAASPPSPVVRIHRIRLPDGTETALDVVIVLGRQPRRPRIDDASPRRLVSLASPTSVVSGTHAEIRQEGDSVVVTDLGSTNGTIVTPLRGRGERLRHRQSLTVLPGTRIDVGDGNIVEILPLSEG